ncbi:serine--tRNA ligase, mitochondrial-like [Portunus trituberculatus]|uniref:serine--tRNA ligase, mitochondrial-like n=1 Tax=Portunus trituberculatus TaxID=210409 RepID=UPI001E1CE4B0|nr:serine--tRNA ligase, mitochondrial-like [Portunus trituberculatus]
MELIMNTARTPINLIRASPHQTYSCIRKLCTTTRDPNRTQRPKLNYEYLYNPSNTKYIERLIQHRKNVGDIHKVLQLRQKLESVSESSHEYQLVQEELEKEALNIPNDASPHLWAYGEEPKVLEYVNPKPQFSFTPLELGQLGQRLDILRTENLGNVTGTRSYFFKGALAQLEHALIKYSVSHLLKKGFTLMSVPDLLYSEIIEDCGMNTQGEHSQVYHIVGPSEGVCLAGTAEMALGGYLRGRQLESHKLPLKLAAVSRCYRAESSAQAEERGIYRVHAFTKVEMFGATAADTGQESHDLYSEMVLLQKELFSRLGIHFQVLDMPLHDLGAPAYTKTDIEAWMPGRGMYGEISSASNCTDYQSARLNITYRDANGRERLVHTVNGTACAVPRLAIALCETFQDSNGNISLPPSLHPYLPGPSKICLPSTPCRTTWLRQKAFQGTIVPPQGT